MTPLRQRFIDDLRLRNYSPRTIETYVLRVAQFAKHFGRSPELLGPKELRRYQEHLVARQVSWSTFNQTVCALRFLYNVTLRRSHLITHLPFAKRPRLLPTVLSPEEVFMKPALLWTMLLVPFIAYPARAIDITACGQVVPDGQIGVLQTDLDCGGTYNTCFADAALACAADPACTDTGCGGVMLRNGATLEMNGHTVANGWPWTMKCPGR